MSIDHRHVQSSLVVLVTYFPVSKHYNITLPIINGDAVKVTNYGSLVRSLATIDNVVIYH